MEHHNALKAVKSRYMCDDCHDQINEEVDVAKKPSNQYCLFKPSCSIGWFLKNNDITNDDWAILAATSHILSYDTVLDKLGAPKTAAYDDQIHEFIGMGVSAQYGVEQREAPVCSWSR